MRGHNRGAPQRVSQRLRLAPTPTLNNQSGAYTPPTPPSTDSFPLSLIFMGY